MSHPTGEELAQYANESSFEGREPMRAHIGTCEQCTEAVRDYADLSSTLRSQETWTPREAGRSATVESISRFDLKWRAESAEAAALMNRLKDVAPAEWPLDEFPRTPAMALEMLKRGRSESERSPQEALRITEATERIVTALVGSEHGSNTDLLKGRIEKERSLALKYLGRFEQALEALDKADYHFSRLSMPDFDLATVAYSRATVLAEIDQYDEALELIDEAGSKFELFGMDRRVLHSRIVRAAIFFYQGRIAEAREEYLLVLQSKHIDETNAARTMSNIACCDLELRAFEQARLWSSRSVELFERADKPVSTVRARWALARAELGLGLYEQGVTRLKTTAVDFAEAGMVTDSALALLHIVEHLITQGDHDEAARLCSVALEQFLRAGMRTPAAHAMGYLRDMVLRGDADLQDIVRTRTIVADSPDANRDLIF